MPLHLLKLAVGVRNPAHLMAIQAARAAAEPPLRHRTRTTPRRADEIVDGGSIYWVIGGAILVRQMVRDIVADAWDDGSACAGLALDPALVSVVPRPVKAFQGWRYLSGPDAPPDRAAHPVPQGDLPDYLRAELQSLCLI